VTAAILPINRAAVLKGFEPSGAQMVHLELMSVYEGLGHFMQTAKKSHPSFTLARHTSALNSFVEHQIEPYLLQ